MRTSSTIAAAFVAALFAAALAAGCAASSQVDAQDATDVAVADADQEEVAHNGAATAASQGADDVVCKRERPLGSNIPRVVCRDQHDAQLRREQDQLFFINMSRWGNHRNQ